MSDPTKLPLYDTVAQMLRESNFMRRGGYLGFFCHHAYAHSTEAGRKLIPGAFRGVDLAIFSAFGGLGLEVDVRPILYKVVEWEYSDDIENVWGGLSAKNLIRGSVSEGNHKGDFVEGYFLAVDRKQRDVLKDHDDDDADCYEHGEDLRQFLKEEMTIVGSEMHGPAFNGWEDQDLDDRGVIPEWTHHKMPKIIWLNEPCHEDFACAGVAYGNQATLDYKFSAAAILVSIPSSRARGLKLGGTMKDGPVEQTMMRSGLSQGMMGKSTIIDLTGDSQIPNWGFP